MTTSRFEAVIFDMDGVLVDGEPMHFAAVNQLLATEGKSISLERYKPYMGTKTGWVDMIADFNLPGSREHYSALYRETMLASYRERSEALPGAVALVRALQAGHMPLAIASSSIRPWVEACLDRIGLLDAFDEIVTGSEVERGKPAPDIYLLTAERLGVEPRSCLVFEDAPAGIESAKNAGMVCWAVRTEYTRGLELPGPQRELESLVGVQPAEILSVAA
ncbi:MAG TPA: HAD family phosphatase [Tepidiformaceae bacterium]|jgi:HAD superfamily hydrolase (TIGR01509 family)